VLHPGRVMLAAVVLLAALIAYLSFGAQSTTADASHETPHLKFTTTVSPRLVTPGEPFTLALDVAPKPGMHVYAPGSKYRPIRITIAPQTSLTIKNAVYPKATAYYFKPLNETVDIYASPFRLLVEMRVNASEQAPASMTLEGVLEYQACDDRECFLPESIPLRWTLAIKPSR
jgi:DsbC/DsbD-like thiol-disulfide interchange protein